MRILKCVVAGSELRQDPIAQGRDVRRGGVELVEGLQQVVCARGDLEVGGQDLAGAVLEDEEAFLSTALAAFGAVFAVHLDDVQRVVDHGCGGDFAAHPVGVADRVEVQDVLDVYAAGGEDLYVPEAVAVEFPFGLLYEISKVAAAVARGVEADGVDRVGDGASGDQSPELLVVEGVDEDGARDVPGDHLVERPGGLCGGAKDEDEGVGDGAGGGDFEALCRQLDGDPVAAAQVRCPLDHRRDRGM